MKEKSITLRDGSFILNGKPFFMYSGEIHYFRTPRSLWRTYLKRAKQAGLNTVSTYIPWRWHEYKQGNFDFTGKTKKERNLLAFLDMTEEENLYLFLRPGPICHGEIIDDGLPGWLLDKYPQIQMRKPDGSYIGRNFVSFLNPTYQKFVKKWYKRVMHIIEQHQITKGGNVILVQLDNEIGMVNWLSKEPDCSKNTEKLYQKFLQQKYHCIENLNKSHHLRFKDFSEVNLAMPSFDTQPNLRYWDWASFWRDYYATYYEFLVKTATSLNIEVPFVANVAQFMDFDVYGRGLYSPMTSSMLKNFPDKTKNLIMGGAYQMRRLDYENFHDVAIATELIKMLSNDNSPSICVELQTGILFDRPLLYPSDVDLNIFTSCGHGLNGLNCYMFASGENCHNLGWLGSRHNWQAPVDLHGKPKPHYKPIKKWGKIFRIFGKTLALSKKETDLSVGFYAPYYMTEYLKGDFVKKIESQRNRFFFDGICRLLELSGYNFEMVDIQSDDLFKKRNVVVFCLDFMDRDTQKKLVRFIKEGGNLIIGPNLPSKDLSGENYTYLRDKLNLYPKESQDLFIKYKKELLYVDRPIRIFDSTEDKAVFMTQSAKKAAVIKKVGKGTVLVYSFYLTHSFNYHIDIMQIFLKKMKLTSHIEKSDTGVQTVIRTNKKAAFLFVANYHQLDKDFSLKLTLDNNKKPLRLPGRGSFRLSGRSCRLLPLNYQLTDRVRIIKTTSQLLDVKKEKNKIVLELEVSPGQREEIVFSLKGLRYIKLDGRKLALDLKKEIQVVEFKPHNSPVLLEIALRA